MRPRLRGLLSALAFAASSLACASVPSPRPPAAPSYAALTAERPAPPVAPERIHALLVNGGGSPDQNYASHVAHLRKMSSLLVRAGVAPAQISILSGDGDDPAPDLAVHEPLPEGALLLGEEVGEMLLDQSRFESSTVPGFALRPATPSELERWFSTVGAGLRGGDTLLLYVTDHGLGNPEDVMDTRIVMWGRRAYVSVRELGAMLETLRPGVRVVALMSQCFSGGFAWLSQRDGERVSEPNVCGYFSARYDLMAYGCYSDLSGEEQGHSFVFMRALEETGSFDDAHRTALIEDATPDVPLRTSDVWLQEMLNALASSAKVDVTELMDALLAKAWEDRAAWEPELRIIDRIGRAYGLKSPRRAREMRDIQSMASGLSRLRQKVEAHAETWSEALEGATKSNLEAFAAASPAWGPRLKAVARGTMGTPERRALAVELLRDLNAFTGGRGEVRSAIELFSEQEDAGAAIGYRTQVRTSALIRMGALLSSIAGRVYLATHGKPELLEAYRAMRACESFTLPLPARGRREGEGPEAQKELLPPIVEELRAADEARPTWIGIGARPASAYRIREEGLPRGAAVVTEVEARSPAAAAGIAPGDVVLGPPGAPFGHPQDFLPWLMLLRVGEGAPLVLRRGGVMHTVTLTPRSYEVSYSRDAGLEVLRAR